MPKKRLLTDGEAIHVSLGVQLLDFDEAQPLADQTWAGAEEVLESVDLSRHKSSAEALRFLLSRGWESDSVTGLMLGIWMKKRAPAGEIVADLMALEPAYRRVLTALYDAETGQSVVQYSVCRDGLIQHSYSRKSMGVADIKVFSL